MKEASALAFIFIALLIASSFLGFQQVGASSCSVSISINPPGGTSFQHGDSVNATLTIDWSSDAPANAAVEIELFSGFWDEVSKIWIGSQPSPLFIGNNSGSGASPIIEDKQLSPGWRYFFNVTLTCTWFYYDQDGKMQIGGSDANKWIEVEYAFNDPTSLSASFSIDPKSPTVNDNITFCSTSTAPNSNIVEYKWYLDNQYLQNVGNNPLWSSKLTIGTHIVKLIVVDNLDVSADAVKSIQVTNQTMSGLLLTAKSDKPAYVTGEKIIVEGKLTYDGSGVISADINLTIHKADGTVDTWPGITNADGTYHIEYPVPKIAFKQVPPKPETWTIEVTALPVETQYRTATNSLTVQVVPVYLQLHSINLVQVVEVPVIDGKTYLAARREAGVRVMVSCPSLAGLSSALNPEVTVLLDISIGATTVIKEPKKVAIGPNPTPVDFIFSLQPGTNYIIGARVDPYYDFMPLSATEQLWMSQIVTVKEMKTMHVEYVPLYFPLMDEDSLSKFDKFCENQSAFVKSVYPLPNSNFKFTEVTETLNPILIVPRALSDILGEDKCKMYLLLSALSIRSFLTADKVVGVLPSDTRWLGPGENGVSEWAYPSLLYYSRATLVRNGSDQAVTAHEIGHTLGLNRWKPNEEYNTNPDLARAVTGLILKDGKIFNITNDDEKNQAWWKTTGTVYCFMGRDLAWPSPSWVCDKTYPDLFKFLMDPPQDVLYVAGAIYSNNTVELDSWYLGEGEPDLVDQGTYTIECVSRTGEVLYSTGFGGEVQDFLGFGFVIPCPEGTEYVQIKKANQLLTEVQRTPNKPTAAIQFPNGGEKLDGATTINWSAEDQDGDQLLSSVLCSQDGGETWTALAIELNGTSYDADFSSFPEGTQYLLKIVVTDGFNTAQSVSGGTFTVDHSSSSDSISLSNPILIVLLVAVVIIAVIVGVFALRKKRDNYNPNTLPPPP